MQTVPPVINLPSDPGAQRKPMVGDGRLCIALLACLAALILAFSNAAASFDEEYDRGQWRGLGGLVVIMTILPLLGATCCGLAETLRRRRAQPLLARWALVIAVLLACPLTSLPLARILSGPAAKLWQPAVDALDRRSRLRGERLMAAEQQAIARHYELLVTQFAEPQRIADADRGWIVLADHKVLRLYGVTYSDKFMADCEDYVTRNLLGTSVVIRLPEREMFRLLYRPGQSSIPPSSGRDVFARSPKDDTGLQYGTITCLVFVDGQLLNSRFEKARH